MDPSEPLPGPCDHVIVGSESAAWAEQQVAAKQDALKAAQKQATADMEKSLQQMSDRIHLVADEKPMELRIAPLTIPNVEKWASEFQSAAGLSAPDTASSKSKDASTSSSN